MSSKKYIVYILTNQKLGTLYIGITSNIARRIYEHQNGLIEGFSKKHGLKRLVYYEVYEEPLLAIQKEKQLKKWKRAWKIELIEKMNSEWKDLSSQLNN